MSQPSPNRESRPRRVTLASHFHKTFLVMAVAYILSSTSSPGATRTWVGGQADNDWHAAENWEQGLLPGADDRVVVPGESDLVRVTGQAVVWAIEMASGATVAVVGPDGRLGVTGPCAITGGTLRSTDGGVIEMPRAERLESGLLAVAGSGAVSLPGLKLFDHSSVHLSGGATWTVPSGVTNYVFDPVLAKGRGTPFHLEGAGTLLDGRSLVSVVLNSGVHDSWIRVLDGAELDLCRVLRLSVSTAGPVFSGASGRVTISVSSGSVLRFDVLEEISGSGTGEGLEFAVLGDVFELPKLEEITFLTRFRVPGLGTVRLPLLGRADLCFFDISDGGTLEADLLADFTHGYARIEGRGRWRVPSLRNIDHSRFAAISGARVVLPSRVRAYYLDDADARAFGAWGSESFAMFQAQGESSLVSAPSLESLSVRVAVAVRHPRLHAERGGVLDLPGLQRISAELGAYWDEKATIELHASRDSEIRIPNLTEVLGRGPCGHSSCSYRGIVFNLQSPFVELPRLEDLRIPSEFIVGTNTVIHVPTVRLVDARIWVSDAGTFVAPLLKELRASSLSLSGSGAFAARNLSDLSGTHIELRAGARYAIPEGISHLDQIEAVSEWYPVSHWFLAEGPGSRLEARGLRSVRGWGQWQASNGGVIDLSEVREIRSAGPGPAALDITMESGGTVLLDSLRQLTDDVTPYGTRFRSDGNLRLANLDSVERGAFEVREGRRLELPVVRRMAKVRLQLRTDARLDAPRFETATESMIEIAPFGILRAETLRLVGGRLTGVGTMEGNLVNQGEVQPGNPIGEPYGTLTVTGNYEQYPNDRVPTGAAGSLVIMAGGRTASGRLEVLGRAVLGGSIAIRLRDNYAPPAGVRTEIGRASDFEGGFWEVHGAAYGPGHEFGLEYSPKTLRLLSSSAAPPTVVAMAPAVTTVTLLESLDVAFSEVIDPGSFLASAVSLLGPDRQPIPTFAPRQIGQAVWRVAFLPQTLPGTYRVTLLPAIMDAAGIAMASAYDHAVELTVESTGSLAVLREETGLRIEYAGVLESAPDPRGPWVPVADATRPYRVAFDEAARFFRSHP